VNVWVAEYLFVHDGLVVFSFACGLYVVLIDDIKVGTLVIDVLVSHSSCVDVDVETLAGGSEVGTDTVTHR